MTEEKKFFTNSLEDKTDFLDRLKYMAVPLALTAGAYFTPELKSKYDLLPADVRDKYKTVFLTGAVILGSLTAASSGYNLFKGYQKKREEKSEALNNS